MDEWSSIEDMVAEFSLSASSDDLELLRQELVQQLREFHPDRTGGSFQSKEDQERYYRISSAIEFVDNQRVDELAVMPSSRLSAVVEAVTRAVVLSSQTALALQTEIAFEEKHKKRVSTQLQFPRISSAAITVICGLVFTFWEYIKDNPVLSGLADLRMVRPLWLLVSTCAGAAFLLTKVYEHLSQLHIEFLLSEEGLISTISQWVIGQSHMIQHLPDTGFRFAKRELVDLLRSGRVRSAGFLWSRGISRDPFLRSYRELPLGIASECAEIILGKLKERGSVRKLPRQDIDEWYEIPSNVVHSLWARQSYTVESDQPTWKRFLVSFPPALTLLVVSVYIVFNVVFYIVYFTPLLRRPTPSGNPAVIETLTVSSSSPMATPTQSPTEVQPTP